MCAWQPALRLPHEYRLSTAILYYRTSCSFPQHGNQILLVNPGGRKGDNVPFLLERGHGAWAEVARVTKAVREMSHYEDVRAGLRMVGEL